MALAPEKILEMEEWAQRNQCFLQQKGEVGFGRPCVGIQYGQVYVDFSYELQIWTPKDSYHKHDCLAVLVQTEDWDNIPEADYDRALEQLYEWVVWLNANNYGVKTQPRETYNKDGFGRMLEIAMGGMSQPVLVKLS